MVCQAFQVQKVIQVLKVIGGSLVFLEFEDSQDQRGGPGSQELMDKKARREKKGVEACKDQRNSLIVLGQAPLKIRWAGRDTPCYHLIKRPFISGQVISTADSRIPLWLLQTTLVPTWCQLPHAFLSWSFGAVGASAPLLIPVQLSSTSP